MPSTEAPPMPVETSPEPMVRPTEKPQNHTQTKRQPPYMVVLHNDNLNGMDYVVGVIRKVCHYGRMKAIWIMLKAHITGRSVVWTGSLEVAELKADQMRSCGPDPNMKERGVTNLNVSVEPLEN